MADLDSTESTRPHDRVWQEHKRVYAALGVVALATDRMDRHNDDHLWGALEAAKGLLSTASENLCQLASDLQE